MPQQQRQQQQQPVLQVVKVTPFIKLSLMVT